VRCTNVNDVCITPDAVLKVIKVDFDGRLTFGEQRLQLLHGYGIVLGVVKCKVANLQKSKAQANSYHMNTYLECNISPIK
jgi:hypothetical protein